MARGHGRSPTSSTASPSPADVGHEADIIRVVETTERDVGPIALFCSNAGLGDFGGTPDEAAASPNAQWQRGWDVNVMGPCLCCPRLPAAHGPHAAAAIFLNTVSAAGLLNQIGNAVYGTTKHAAIGFAENLAFTHRDQGIRVSVLCPQGVDTALLRAGGHGPQHLDGVLAPDAVGDFVMQALRDETFLVLPHPQVLGYMRNKTENYDRWLGGMAKLRRQLKAGRL